MIAREHWSSSGFANTDLDLQLRRRGIERVIFIGLLANTCIETSAKYAAELGYHVTLVRDATAAFKPEAMHAAHVINGPTYAHQIVSSAELIAALQAALRKEHRHAHYRHVRRRRRPEPVRRDQRPPPRLPQHRQRASRSCCAPASAARWTSGTRPSSTRWPPTASSVITFDYSGLGQSTGERSMNPLVLAQDASDLIEALDAAGRGHRRLVARRPRRPGRAGACTRSASATPC